MVKNKTKNKTTLKLKIKHSYPRTASLIAVLVLTAVIGTVIAAQALADPVAKPKVESTVVATRTAFADSDQPAAGSTPAATPAAATTPAAAPAKAKSSTATATSAPAPVVSAIPKSSALYVPSAQSATINQAAAATGSSSDAAVLRRLADKSTATWFGGWTSNVRSAVNGYVSSAQAAGQVPVMVAYNIPFRDCGGESGGGASGTSSYNAWIQDFAGGISGRSAIVILEPDAVAADCFDATRAAMLSDAVKTLQGAGATVYLDAGNPTWRSATDMAGRLNQAGVAYASGFSLNVSNFQTTSANISYGSALSAQLNGKHFVIDTSRNGNGPTGDSQWCNPAGRALGAEPTTNTGYRLVDAFLWIKVPGESDGRCGPAIGDSQPPSAGSFWPQYALMLARNAGW